MAPRVDFKAVRAQADFARVLAAYNIDLQKDGSKEGQFKALCPFHEDTKPSLKVNTAKNLFHCFACEAKGNVLDFVMQMDGIDIRPAALKVQDICGLSGQGGMSAKQREPSPPPPPPKAETPEEELDGTPYNPPLTFELNLTMDAKLQEWLSNHGIDDAAVESFGLGRASKRSKSIGNRLAIPLHDQAGRLIGYCGRHVSEDDEPKYRLPKGFKKELEWFNWHRLPKAPTVVVIFESYLSVMRHHQHVPCLSPFGRTISGAQIDMLRSLNTPQIIVVFDGDSPGYTGAADVAGQLAPYFWVCSLHLPEGTKPHHLAWDKLRPLLVDIWERRE